MTIVPTIRPDVAAIIREQSSEEAMIRTRAGVDSFKEFYRTGDISHLFAGYREMLQFDPTGQFIDKLRVASGAREFGSEFPGLEYELKMNVMMEPASKRLPRSMSPFVLATTVHRTFNRMRKYLAQVVTSDAYTDVHYFGDVSKTGKELLLIEEGPPQKIVQKTDEKFFENTLTLPQTAFVVKRREAESRPGKLEDVLRTVMFAANNGATYCGPAVKGKSHVRVLDTRDGRVYAISASETTANDCRMYQVEVEYKGLLRGFAGYHGRDAYEWEENIVQGIYDMAMHVRRRISWDQTRPLLLEPTLLCKYDFVKQVQGAKSARVQTAHERNFDLVSTGASN